MATVITICAVGVRAIIPKKIGSIQILYKNDEKDIDAHFVMTHDDVYEACLKFRQDMASSGRLVCRRDRGSENQK
jgi:hypothetical protein